MRAWAVRNTVMISKTPLDYELDSYTVPFADLAAAGDDDEGTIVFSPDDGEPGDE